MQIRNVDTEMTDIEIYKYAIIQRDKLINQLIDALSVYANGPLHCIDKGKQCGLCAEFDTCSYRRNRLLIDKAKAILRATL